jgi:hypothetical protein
MTSRRFLAIAILPELDRKLIVIAMLIIALPIIAALAAMLAALAVGDH